jgi:hypothetical protein
MQNDVRLCRLLIRNLPAWAIVQSNQSNSFCIDATIPKFGGSGWPVVRLTIASRNAKLCAKETKPILWPAFCPERHINDDGTFCLGISDVPSVNDKSSAISWWSYLQEYLDTQFVAGQTKKWPPNKQFAHGDAGIAEEALEKLTKGTKFEQEVGQAHQRNVGWLASTLPRIHKTCPRGCNRKGRPILRRNCVDRELMFQIVALEHRYRQGEAAFWKSHSGTKCCGYSEGCGLYGK